MVAKVVIIIIKTIINSKYHGVLPLPSDAIYELAVEVTLSSCHKRSAEQECKEEHKQIQAKLVHQQLGCVWMEGIRMALPLCPPCLASLT